MFHKLRLQFAMVNVAIIFLVFVLLTTGSYLFLKKQSLDQAKMFSQRMAAGISLGVFPEQPPAEGPFPFAFFIKTDAQGNVISSSPQIPLAVPDLKILARNVWNKQEVNGLIAYGNSDYYFNKVSDPSAAERLMIFQEFDRENNMLQTLVVSLAAVGFICLIFSLLGSFFLGNQVVIPIQKSWQQQRDFLADVSHELRTPLAVIRTNLDIVLDNPEDTEEAKQKWLKNVKEETEYMANLVNSLLFLASSDARQLTFEKKLFNFNHVVTNSVQQFQPGAIAKGIVLKATAAKEIFLNGDEFRIKQVIEILLDNALRHTSEGGTINLSLSQTGKTVTLLVADTGEGIAAEHLDKIFDRFYQAEKSRSKGGAGLGLSIAKCIIENHQGSISVTSTLGSGTTFKVDLPV
jgi:two-component system sensor histidine kinase CiaH